MMSVVLTPKNGSAPLHFGASRGSGCFGAGIAMADERLDQSRVGVMDEALLRRQPRHRFPVYEPTPKPLELLRRRHVAAIARRAILALERFIRLGPDQQLVHEIAVVRAPGIEDGHIGAEA